MAQQWHACRARCTARWFRVPTRTGRSWERSQARWPCARTRVMRNSTAGAYAGVAEAVDARVSKTRSFGSVSSSLTARTSRLTMAGAFASRFRQNGPALGSVSDARTTFGWPCSLPGPATSFVMPGLDPGIQLSSIRSAPGKHVDGRNKSGHDVTGVPHQYARSSLSGHQQSRVLLRSQSEIVPAYSFHSFVLSLT